MHRSWPGVADPRVLAAITRFAETLAVPGIDDQSEHFQAIQLREALDEAMPAFTRAGISHQLRSSRDQRGAYLIQSLLADLDSLFGELSPFPEGIQHRAKFMF